MSALPLRIPLGPHEIAGSLHRPSPEPGIPCVVLCHGLLSSKESPKFRALAQAFSAAGMAALRFDFLGCGASDGDLRETTVSGRVRELLAVLDHAREVLGITGPLGLLGSSMGGFVSLLAFARGADVRALCVWATPFDLTGLAGFKGHPDLAGLGPAFFEDLGRHDLKRFSPAIHHVLVLHGERDEIVPQDHGQRLFAQASEPKALHVFPGGDHRFTNLVQRRQATRMSLEWLQRFLA